MRTAWRDVIDREFVADRVGRRAREPFNQAMISNVSSNLRAILPIALAKLLFEVMLLTPNDPEMHDREQRDQYDKTPPRVHRHGEAEKQHRQRDVEWIARVTKRTGCNERCRWTRRVDVRPGGPHRSSSPYREAHANRDQSEARPEEPRISHDRQLPEP